MTDTRQRQSELGQFMTPTTVARFMAGLFQRGDTSMCRLLDAGAGRGALTSAFLERCIAGDLKFDRVDVVAYEVDERMRDSLAVTLAGFDQHAYIHSEIVSADFIEVASELSAKGGRDFTHAILNPPYKKINSQSGHRSMLRRAGIETVNLYSGFVALALDLMKPGGTLVAIIPRSFCNGPYYRPFRDRVLARSALKHMHLFDSRDKAFREDEVLQENVIIVLERDGRQGDVTISTSTDDSFDDLATFSHPFERIVFPDDPEHFIHVPTNAERNAIELSTAVRCSLAELGLTVSTGPVVDFRLKEHLREMPGPLDVPLLYPGHFRGQLAEWPRPGLRKPNAIERNAETERWLYPTGFYCVVRRFSSKEERRRVVASVVEPKTFGAAEVLGLENHLNVFHEGRKGLSEPLARGLAMFLNTTAVDENFRRFNGHTQVNATDLKLMKYPSREALIDLGRWAMRTEAEPSQFVIDDQFEKLAA